VDLDSFGEPYLERLRASCKEHGREFWVLDLTTDLGIPVFASITRRTDGLPEQIMPGFGAHLDPKIALLRAVTEMNQMLSSPLLRKEKGGEKEPVDPETAHWLETATTANQPYLLPAEGPPRAAASYPRPGPTTWPTTSRLPGAGRARGDGDARPRPDTPGGRPAGRQGHCAGAAAFLGAAGPGRLYDVPVRLGWLSRPLAEHELNPIPMFL
jgi:Uncharacterized conserved protein